MVSVGRVEWPGQHVVKQEPGWAGLAAVWITRVRPGGRRLHCDEFPDRCTAALPRARPD